MKTNIKITPDKMILPHLADQVKDSWKLIAPFWTLNNLIAVNPLQGFEDLNFEDAVQTAEQHFCRNNLPSEMNAINRECIKWFQAYFDDGQASLPIPYRERGLYCCWKELAVLDPKLHQNKSEIQTWLAELPDIPLDAIEYGLNKLKIDQSDRQIFLNLMLTTLPGWAAHVKYLTEWSCSGIDTYVRVTQEEFLAIRILTVMALWPEAERLLQWHSYIESRPLKLPLNKEEDLYAQTLLHYLSEDPTTELQQQKPAAQFVFCIDVRSEPMRRAIEQTGNYETYGFAGFFGIPIAAHTETETYTACPVLLQPSHVIDYRAKETTRDALKSFLTRLYQSLKYGFTTPFALVEALGFFSGIATVSRNLFPTALSRPCHREHHPIDISAIPFNEQCAYAEQGLTMMGLVHHFAPYVILCGHGSTTQNNAFATALDCGACAGRHGDLNAQVFAMILNNPHVRSELRNRGIDIPATTQFIPALHNTTTDQLSFLTEQTDANWQTICQDIQAASRTAFQTRSQHLPGGEYDRSIDWSQVRPEWGLARNASFIVGPRFISSRSNLEGRSFLHSYDWRLDPEGTYLTTILTAPMVVAQWINCQYLFSTYDNAAYGAGSKITKNVTGKIGIMQGNASDLMTGLPLQSVHRTDLDPYHQPLRLLTVVYAPKTLLDTVIQRSDKLKNIFGKGWVNLICMDPINGDYRLLRDLTWEALS